MRNNRLYNALMWLVKLLFLITIGYAASDISPDSGDEEDSIISDVTLNSVTNSYIPTHVTPVTEIRLSSFTDSMTT